MQSCFTDSCAPNWQKTHTTSAEDGKIAVRAEGDFVKYVGESTAMLADFIIRDEKICKKHKIIGGRRLEQPWVEGDKDKTESQNTQTSGNGHKSISGHE